MTQTLWKPWPIVLFSTCVAQAWLKLIKRQEPDFHLALIKAQHSSEQTSSGRNKLIKKLQGFHARCVEELAS